MTDSRETGKVRKRTFRRLSAIAVLAGCVAALLIWFCFWILQRGPGSPGSRQRYGAPVAGVPSESAEPDSPAKRHYLETFRVPPDYQAAALQAMIQEVGRFVDDLGLPEKNRPTTNNLVEAFVVPPRVNKDRGTFAVIRVGDYTFSAALGNKLCFIHRFHLEPDGLSRDLDDMRARATLPKDRVDTERAHQLALKWLRAAHMDAGALERTCSLKVRYWDMGDTFVPLYWIIWSRGGTEAAQVKLFEPDSRLLAMDVYEERYNLRRRLTADTQEAGARPNSSESPSKATKGSMR